MRNPPERLDLELELGFYGIGQSPDEFRGTIWRVFRTEYRRWTVDGLMCVPSEAMWFCSLVRSAVRERHLPDYVILRTLFNIRKQKHRKFFRLRFDGPNGPTSIPEKEL